tara:strand:- start:2790 stop:4640 length:1851 start_codon:yes stop_codon:yes gene_type:complete
MINRLSVFLFVPLIACAVASAQPLTPVPVKQVAAPPLDITSGMVKLPDPSSIPVVSHSAMIPVDMQRINGQWSWSTTLDVQQRGARIALLPVQADTWSSTLLPNNQARIPAVDSGTDSLAWVAPDREFTHLSIQENQAGDWTLTIRSDHDAPGYVLIDAGPKSTLSTHVTTLSTLQSQPITLRAAFEPGTRMTSLSAEITSPSGLVSTELAQPGASELTFFPEEVGSHSVRVIAQGITADGSNILLTTQHLIDAAPQAPMLKQASIQSNDEQIVFTFAPDDSQRRTILAAEVWGRLNNQPTPVAWLSTIVGQTRALTLDTRWVAASGVDPETLELRAVRLHDIDSMVPLEIIDRVAVPVSGITLPEAPASISPDMLTGKPGSLVPAKLTPQITQSAGPGHRLMLVHGYCTDAVPFTVSHYSGDLSLFEDFEQSRSHDAFALELLAQSSPMKSFGIVAHSQGGMAALHLRTFYWSGLDWAKGNRLIQTVGAPYQGTALAGNAAVLGDIFGFGCGTNDNMTYAGSASWLSLIPSWARDDVYYYTTSFEDGFFFDYCNIITDLILSDPDDGVIERSAGQLSGAHNMGHLEGWCHSEGMRDPGQCTDQNRNTIMNQEAKR